MITTLLLCSLPWLPTPQEASQEADETRLGHSAHGEAYDEGPRQRPWRMENIGTSHFPITTSVPEVQEWFDQGNTLLHNFWFYEAERSFRWCLKLDPDCAMAYWGLARSQGRSVNDRGREFLEEAVARKDNVSERERMYIEVFERAYAPELSGAIETLDEKGRRAFEVLAEELEAVVIAYPDDVEAKALHMLYSLYDGSRVGLEYVAQSIFAEQPLHPGAHHYRIHNWDGPEGAQALDSCEAYGELASYVGHANHMPGHIYSGIGMWHEAGRWMDRATRVEKDYMGERLVFPFNHWNHSHNRNYLSYIQEQLGLASAAEDGARQLLAAPHDPKYNDPEGGYSVYLQGKTALLRNLVKFERWEVILEEDTIPWREGKSDEVWRAYMEALAHLGLGQEDEAVESMIALKKLDKSLGKNDRARRFLERMLLEVRAELALLRGERIDAVRLFEEAAGPQLDGFHEENDPPSYPRILSNCLGEAYLSMGAHELAAEAFERTLETVINDGFALSGLVEAYSELGQEVKARTAFGRLSFVWADADPELRWWTRAQARGLESEFIDFSPRRQKRYGLQDLTAFGPGTWEGPPAPGLDVLDSDGDAVTLAEYAGKLTLVVFYIGDRCAHCVEQLVALDERSDDLADFGVEVLAISGDSPETNAKSEELGALAVRLLSDPDYANAKRWKSFDDFEEIELHSTYLVDGDGRVRWARIGGEPFMELDFLFDEVLEPLVEEAERVSQVSPAGSSAGGGSSGR